MIAKTLLVAILAATMTVGCTRTPNSTQLAQLTAAAPAVLSQATPDGDISAEYWPPAVATLSPERVYSSPDGLYLVLSSSFVRERGLFVPRSTGFAGGTGTDPSYTSVGQGVFSYRIKG
jgi:hypothetical protein